MSYSLVLNSSNVVAGSNNNTYRYNFIQGSFNIPENSEISISSVILPYSFFNKTKAYNNNILHYFFPLSAGFPNNFTDFTITIPDGFYTTTDINNFFKAIALKMVYIWLILLDKMFIMLVLVIIRLFMLTKL